MVKHREVAKTWLYNTLTNDATLVGATLLNGARIYANQAPQNAIYPLNVYKFVATRYSPLRRINSRILAESMLFDVMSCTKNTVTNLYEIDSRIEELLDAQPDPSNNGIVTGGQVIACTRESDIDFVENDGGVDYHYTGGTYLIQAVLS